MIVDAVSDLHGQFPPLEGGDLLIVAGDLTARDLESEYFVFFDWLHEQEYTKKVIIAGNHDVLMQEQNYKGPEGEVSNAFTYLCDSGTEFEGLKIWGSPWTRKFLGQNPNCMAFALAHDWELGEKWNLIPKDTDILITHEPPFGFGDSVERRILDERGNPKKGKHRVGSPSLLVWLTENAKTTKLHVFGHVHEGHGRYDLGGRKKKGDETMPEPLLVNASYLNEHYDPVNKPVRIIL